MADTFLIREILTLPPAVPPCVVEIKQFDDPRVVKQNVEDYVITARVGDELYDLLRRIITSAKRHEGGQGHYVHGSFGSGKSHFMATAALILSNHPEIWNKPHPTLERIHNEYGDWLANNSILVIPVYMLGQLRLQTALYNAANERLEALGKPPCQFSQASKVIERFRRRASEYGDVVYENLFAKSKKVKQRRLFDALAESEPDALAAEIMAVDAGVVDVDPRALYPDSVAEGMAQLTRHAQNLGYAAAVFLLDELILYLSGKSGREYVDELNDLGAIVDPANRAEQAIPLWVVVAKQRNIQDTFPEDTSQKGIFDAMEWQKDRFPHTTTLADVELLDITEQRVLKPRPDQADTLKRAVDEIVGGLRQDVRQTLLHEQTLDDFRRVYPFHPALLRTLIDVTARLSKERTGIRLLYELLIERYPQLPLGNFVPYAALFDVIFMPDGIVGGKQDELLEAYHQTYYERLLPVITELYGSPSNDANGQLARATTVVKTILLCQLTRTMRDQITVDRILHLNYNDLRGRTDLGATGQITTLLKQLASRSPLVHFTDQAQNPGRSTVSITVERGPDLRKVLGQVSTNWGMRIDAFSQIMRGLLGNKTIRNGEVQDYVRVWRGTRRAGKVVFRNVRELSANDITVQGEFTLFIDYPFETEAEFGSGDDRSAIERARFALGARPVGFWLPKPLSEDDLRDLDEYTKILQIENNPTALLDGYSRAQKETLEGQLSRYKQAKLRLLDERLVQVYLGGEVVFLDPDIAPNLNTKTVADGLDRIADTVLDRLHPYHPRFGGEADQRSLRRLLNEFLVPAATGNGTVARSADVDDLLKRLGEPLELADPGVTNWALRKQSRYLVKLDELARGRRIDADAVRDGLTRAFGFTRDLSDLFLLYLIRGQGYRVFKSGKPVAPDAIEFGKLSGATLERGQQLDGHEWKAVKELAAETWRLKPPAGDLNIAAQDALWQEMNHAARAAQPELEAVERNLANLLNEIGAELSTAPRWCIARAAQQFNTAAARANVDSAAGIRDLLGWNPTEAGVTRAQAAAAIAQRSVIQAAFAHLQSDTVKRIADMARGGDPDAEQLRAELAAFLVKPQPQADLATHALAWSKQANAHIDERLKYISTVAPPGKAKEKYKTREEPPQARLTQADLEVEADATLDANALASRIRDALKMGTGLTVDDDSAISIKVKPTKKRKSR